MNDKGTFVIVSEKKGIRALSEKNDNVEFHNKLFNTDDCIITWQNPPTKEEFEIWQVQAEIDRVKTEKEQIKEIKIQAEMQRLLREQAVASLKAKGEIE